MISDSNFIDEIRDAVEDRKLRLTQSEEEFLESAEGRLERGRELTVPMREWLDRIHERINPWYGWLGVLYGWVENLIDAVCNLLIRLSRTPVGYIIVVAIVIGLVFGMAFMRLSCGAMK